MGIKHLKKIEDLLTESKRPLLKGQIRNQLGMNLGLLDEALDYLVDQGKVKKTKTVDVSYVYEMAHQSKN